MGNGGAANGNAMEEDMVLVVLMVLVKGMGEASGSDGVKGRHRCILL